MKRLSLFALLGCLSFATTIIPPKSKTLELTIYNNNRAFIHELREVNVPAGKQRLIYPNVPRSLITASVVPDFSGLPVTLYSQNYVYDLINLDSMLQKSIGHKIYFIDNEHKDKLKEGILLASEPSVMVREQKSGHILALKDSSQVIFPSLPPNMITRPSLVWNIYTPKGGMLKIDLKYLSKGISWKSDYVVDLHPKVKKLDLVGWITVNNRSGVSYPDAKITCLAGEVHTARRRNRYPMLEKSFLRAMPAPSIKEESFAGYHIYKIPFRETIANKEQKQIRFLQKRGVRYENYAQAQIDSFPQAGVQKLKFQNILRLQNSKTDGLGIPLPMGIVRIYSRDKNASTHFIGESRIANIPVDEPITLHIGTLFDATGEKRTVKYIAREGYLNIKSLYTLHNRSQTPVTLKILERIPTRGNTIRLDSSCSKPCSIKKISAFVREFTVRLKAKESYKFSSEFEVIR